MSAIWLKIFQLIELYFIFDMNIPCSRVSLCDVSDMNLKHLNILLLFLDIDIVVL